MTLLDEIAAETEAYGLAVEAGTMVDPDGVVAVIVSTPVGDLGYGRDLSCIDDLTANMDEVDENSPQAVEESLHRRITTPHGALNALGEDPDYGRDVRAFLSESTDAVTILAQQDLLAAECKKDDRVKTCECTITHIGGGEFDVSITGELYNGQTYELTGPLERGSQLLEDVTQ